MGRFATATLPGPVERVGPDDLLEVERQRIARELHDSVAQAVLSAGLAVELARGEAELIARAFGHPAGSVPGPGPGDEALQRLSGQLAAAKRLSAEAVDELRRAIFALHHARDGATASLSDLVHDLAADHRPGLAVEVRVEGVAHEPGALRVEDVHDLGRAVGEALANVARHGQATRAVARLRFRRDELCLGVADDGVGDPARLSRLLEVARRCDADGRHRGLVNMEARVVGLGGTLAFRRARLGGVRVELRVPLPVRRRGTAPTVAGATDR